MMCLSVVGNLIPSTDRLPFFCRSTLEHYQLGRFMIIFMTILIYCVENEINACEENLAADKTMLSPNVSSQKGSTASPKATKKKRQAPKPPKRESSFRTYSSQQDAVVSKTFEKGNYCM